MSEAPTEPPPKWHHPSEVIKLQKLKKRKKALQARITGNILNKTAPVNKSLHFDEILTKKRKNPFAKNTENNKRTKLDPPVLEESTDQTLFKLLHENRPANSNNALTSLISFENILNNVKDKDEILVVKAQGEIKAPIDWALKMKVRLWSIQPFQWSQKLKIGEEASGTTGYVRCLNTNSDTNLDNSPNAKFHQCCLFWQQPSLPWLSLFPRTNNKPSQNTFNPTPQIKTSLQNAYSDSLKSLFQLIRTKQCPYFYLCANQFTVLFRAAGICGISDVHAIITPTTRGFRHMLKQEDIEFTMPLKKQRVSDQGYDTLDSTVSELEAEENKKQIEEEEEEEETPDVWLKQMGINADDIKQINYTQAKIIRKAECAVDNSEESLVLVEGIEVHALYNFLINCKSATALTGPFAGIPPTILAPVAFKGATLNTLKVRESKVHVDNADFYSLELTGPILPSTVHNLLGINSSERSISLTFSNVPSTLAFSRVIKESKGNSIFEKENLSDCGLDNKVLEHFCTPNIAVTNVECLKYNSDSKTFTWT